MKNLYSKLFLLAALVIPAFSGFVQAQSVWDNISTSRSYTRAVGSTSYTPITGGTPLTTVGQIFAGNANSSGEPYNVAVFPGTIAPQYPLGIQGDGFPIGFDFVYAGQKFNRFGVYFNGGIQLGRTGVPFEMGYGSVNDANWDASITASPLSVLTSPFAYNKGFDNSIWALGRNLIPQVGSEIRYELTGIAPNRVLVVQWKKMARSVNSTVDDINFQIRISETTNEIKMVYGNFNLGKTTVAFNQGCMVGLRGLGADVNGTSGFGTTTAMAQITGTNRRFLSGAVSGVQTDWSAPISEGTPVVYGATHRHSLLNTFKPSNGLTYTFSTPASNPFGTTAPAMPNLATASVSGTSVTLTWEAPVVGTAASYSVKYRVLGTTGGWISATGSPFATTTATITGLTAGTAYEFAIQSLGSTFSGSSNASGVLTVTAGNGLVVGQAFSGFSATTTLNAIISGSAPTTAGLTGTGSTGTYSCNVASGPASTLTGRSPHITIAAVIPGANENCSLASSLAVNASLNPLQAGYTRYTMGLTNDGGNSCTQGSADDDIWLKFTTPATNTNSIVITTTTGFVPFTASSATGNQTDDFSMEVYSGTCGALTQIACNDDQEAGVLFEPEVRLCGAQYAPNTTYYIRMYTWFTERNQKLDVQIYEDVACPSAPSNDECSLPNALGVEDFGQCASNYASGTTLGATPSAGSLPAATCDPTTKRDVFFTFTTGASDNALNLDVLLNTASDLGVQVITACNGSQVYCAADASGSRTIQGLTPNSTYLLRFWTNTAPGVIAGDFDICLSRPADCPTGLGTGVVNVPSLPYTSEGRSTCGQVNDITGANIAGVCGSSSYLGSEDEIFVFQVPTNGQYQILVSSNTIDLGIRLFNGCPLVGRGGVCIGNAQSNSSNQSLVGLNLTAGSDYYLIVDNGPLSGCINEYSVTIQAAPAAPANNDCGGAINIPQSSGVSFQTFEYSASATLSSPSTQIAAGTCSGASPVPINDDDVWYSFTANTTNPVITVSPSSGYTPVIQLFSGACGSTTLLCCAFASSPGETIELQSSSALTIGVIYRFRVFDFYDGPPETFSYGLSVSNAPVPALTCATCPAGALIEAEACGASSNGTTATSVLLNDGQTGCGKVFAACGTRDLDYYRVTLTSPGYINVTVNSQFAPQILIQNSAGTTVSSLSLPVECAGNINYTHYNPLSAPAAFAAGTYYIVITTGVLNGYACGYGQNDYVLTYNFTSTPPAPPSNDNCSNAIPLTVCGGPVTARTLLATQSLAPILCGGFTSTAAEDIWFKFTANATQTKISTSGTFNGVMEVFADYCGGPGVTCSNANSPNLLAETLTFTTIVGKTYYVRYYALNTTGPPVPGNFSISVTVPNGWSGLVDNNWTTSGNWCDAVPPSSGTDAVIPNVANDPVVPAAGAAVKSINLNPGAVITLNGVLNVKGNITSQGNNAMTGTGSVLFDNNGIQTISGGTLELGNATVNVANPSNLNLASGGKVDLTGNLTVGTNGRLLNNGTFTVVSSATKEGSIGLISTGGQVNGNYVVQRYVPFTNAGWHFMGSTISSGDFSQWTDDFEITCQAPIGALPNALNLSEPDRSTVFRFVEAAHNIKLDTVQKDGWRVPTSTPMEAGAGYRVFLKPSYFAINPSKVLENVGVIATGTAGGGGFSFPLMTRSEFPATSDPTISNPSNRGWNLLSNPFPSAINWDAAGWTKPSQMNNAFFVYNGVLGGYRTYVGAGGISLGVTASELTDPNLIPKGQGFFVKLTNAGVYNATLKADETVKNSGAASFVRTATASNNLRLRISKVGNTTGYEFDAMVRFMDGATEGFDQHMDANFLRGTYESVAFKVGDEDMILSSLPSLDGYRVVPVRSFYSGQTGQFMFNFLELSTFPTNVHIYLKDRVLNSIVDVRQYPSYTFTVATTNNLNSNDRFELVFSPTAITDVKSSINGSAVFSLYPNPSNGNKVVASMIGFDNESNVTVIITDVLGKVVYSARQTIGSGNSAEHAISAKLAAGVYNVSCIGKSHKFTTKLVVD